MNTPLKKQSGSPLTAPNDDCVNIIVPIQKNGRPVAPIKSMFDQNSPLILPESRHAAGTVADIINSEWNRHNYQTAATNGSGDNDSRNVSFGGLVDERASSSGIGIPEPIVGPATAVWESVSILLGLQGTPVSRSSSMRSIFRRSAITSNDLQGSIADKILDLQHTTSVKDWIRSFRDLDPRFQILDFFNNLSLEGVDNFELQGCHTKDSAYIPILLKMFAKVGIFSVWRPTSPDAIAKMISGKGTGKGLEIKGKSAKCGEWSGFVPYLQIHDNEHKLKVGCMTKDKRVRVFYPNQSARDMAADLLAGQSKVMTDRAAAATKVIEKEDEMREQIIQTSFKNISRPSLVYTRDINEALMESNRCFMNNPAVYKIDDYAYTQGTYGLDIPEKLFWESYVVPNDITRPKGSKHDTGRPSMPEFQQMNIETLRNWSKNKYSNTEGSCVEEGTTADPRPVLWHGGCGLVGEEAPEETNPMCPLGLLMAYEEIGKITPVVSDFDCYLVGTRGVKYHKPLGTLEQSMLSWCVEEIEGILATPKEGSCWTSRWLEVKKKHAQDETLHHQMPKFGYADPLSYSMMTGAVHHLKSNGAVRHGPEAFNYGFPQELDDKYLVISDTFPGVPWRYANSDELIDILCEKIDEGFTFPLNPKWILCDPGWKKVYDQLLASKMPNVQNPLSIWYPDEIRRRIYEISTKFPQGFVSSNRDPIYTDLPSGVRIDLAQLEFQRYMVRLSSAQKLQDLWSTRSLRSLPQQTFLSSESENKMLQSSLCESKAQSKGRYTVHNSPFWTALKVVHFANKNEQDKKKSRNKTSTYVALDVARSRVSLAVRSLRVSFGHSFTLSDSDEKS